MFSYETYKIVHLLGIFLVLTALAGVAIHVANGGTKAANPSRKVLAAFHGAGLFIVLLGGFGLLARLGMVHGAAFPGWIWAKLAIWILVGALVAVPYRKPNLARPIFLLLPVLGAVAAWLAIRKPF